MLHVRFLPQALNFTEHRSCTAMLR